MTQISTSVEERTEDVALTPRAGTLWVASSVLVNEDTREMESSAKVRQLKEYCTLSCISYRENICRYTLSTSEFGFQLVIAIPGSRDPGSRDPGPFFNHKIPGL